MAKTPNAPTNMSFLFTRRKFLEATRTPAPAAVSHAVLLPAVIITDSVPPSVPTGLAATAISSSQINLSWSASTDTGGSSLQGYRVYRNGGTTPINPAGSTATSFSDTGLAASTAYNYRVSAYDGQGNESAQSSQASATTQASGASANEVADWLRRSGGTGVVWAHNFDTAAELNQFRKTDNYGVDPSGTHGTTAVWVSNDGFAGGGCVSVVIPTGSTANGGWQRPMSAINAVNNGKSIADNAANGTIALQSWDSSNPAEAYNWRKGYYVHPAIQATYPTWPAGTSGVYDGYSWYFSVRVKIQSSRWTSGNPPGKLIFFDVMEGLSNEQELVVRSAPRVDSIGGNTTYAATNGFQSYTSRGDDANSIVGEVQGSYTGSIEPGGPYAATCTFGGTKAPGACWEYPSDQWTTLLIRFVPGRDNRASVGSALSAWPFNDTILEAWKCDSGESKWTKVFEHFALKWYYYSSPQSGTNGPNGEWHAPAFNEILLSGYMNGVNSVLGWYQRFTQPILSKNWIPPPDETAPAYWTALADSTWTTIANGTGQHIGDHVPSPIPSTPLGGEGVHGLTDAWDGMTIDYTRRQIILGPNGGHADYPGNEFYVCPLGDASPAWRRITDPTPNSYLATYTTTNGVNTYGDGRPRSDHTSCWPVYQDGRVWFPAQSATPPGGAAGTGVYAFNRDRLGDATSILAHTDNGGAFNPFELYGTIPGMSGAGPNGAFTFGCACGDPWNNYVYAFSGIGYDRTTFYYWRVKTLGPTMGQSESFIGGGGNPYANAKWAVCAYDLGICVIGDGSPNQRILVMDISQWGQSNPFQSVTNVTGTGYYGPGGIGIACGSAYIAKNNTIGIGDPINLGRDIFRLKIPTKTVAGRKVYDPAGQWQWTRLTPGGPTIQTLPFERTFSKFNFVPDMGDGRSAFTYIGGPDLPTYIYKIPAAGL